MIDDALADRFERSVDRSGDHHVWTGATNNGRGTGRLKVQGRNMTAQRVAWELVHGPIPPSVKVLACPYNPACVRVDHLRRDPPERDLRWVRARAGGQRNRRGSGSLQRVRPGVWKLTARTPPDATGRTQRVHRNISARNEREATDELARFVAEVRSAAVMAPADQQTRMDDAVERFLSEYLQDEKGREDKTIRDYRALHRKWFSGEIGRRLVRDVDRAAMDRAFGAMRRAGLSRSRLNQARSLYAPFFRWARSRGLTRVDPMAGFDLPTSSYVSTERMPPEVDELCLFLAEAVKVIPDVAPILVLGAVTGMRRGELVGLRRSHIRWRDLRITVNSATDGHRVKTTKTREERKFFIDQDTMAMLARVCEQQDQLAVAAGTAVVLDPFVFSLTIDASEPMPADYVTKRVAILKDHLGIAQKSASTIAREDEALALFRQPTSARKPGRTGPNPAGAITYREIGAHFERSERWASLAVASAERREEARSRDDQLDFDGSILALRKFTSSELLDAGFNISMVAHRQGHGPQVLAKHYAKSRRSADRKAAEHLGRVVHRSSAPS